MHRRIARHMRKEGERLMQRNENMHLMQLRRERSGYHEGEKEDDRQYRALLRVRGSRGREQWRRRTSWDNLLCASSTSSLSLADFSTQSLLALARRNGSSVRSPTPARILCSPCSPRRVSRFAREEPTLDSSDIHSTLAKIPKIPRLARKKETRNLPP